MKINKRNSLIVMIILSLNSPLAANETVNIENISQANEILEHNTKNINDLIEKNNWLSERITQCEGPILSDQPICNGPSAVPGMTYKQSYQAERNENNGQIEVLKNTNAEITTNIIPRLNHQYYLFQNQPSQDYSSLM